VRVEGVQVTGHPLPPLPLTWEERDTIWTFEPEQTLNGE
jgi:hypothetical protein